MYTETSVLEQTSMHSSGPGLGNPLLGLLLKLLLVAPLGDVDEDQDDELTIPRAAMNKMIKELLPNIRVANEARELVLNCCTEFIHLISSESNDICNQQQKKTISAEHVLAALEKLGYGDFRKDAEEVRGEACQRGRI